MTSATDARVDVCICAYRRPEIVQTIQAVANQDDAARHLGRIIVADNTVAGEMIRMLSPLLAELGPRLVLVHAPANNISIARNACLDAARAPWIAFVDDDEIPASGWLKALLTEAAREGWDAVLGPVNAVYPGEVPGWMVRGDFHSTRPVWIKGRINTAYTGNILFRRALADRLGLRFREELGKSGGEDEDFFYRFADGGGSIGFAPDAVVLERVSMERTSLRWLMRRNFRAGQSHGARLEMRGGRLFDILLAAAKASFCCIGALLHALDAVRRNRFLARASLHAGVVSRLLSLKPLPLYQSAGN